MASKADKKKKQRKTSTARRRAETHKSGGGEFSTFRIPEGVSIWKPTAGIHKLDIVGFVAGEGNPHADEGELHFERTFFQHPRVGVNEDSFICPRKTSGKKCPVCEGSARLAKDPDASNEERKALLPKERQLWLIYVHAEKDKGLQLWEYSYHNFGKLLDFRVKTSDEDDGWDLFYYHDTDGMTLTVAFEEESSPYGKFLDAKSIDFKPRKRDLPAEISTAAEAICLDELIKIPTYEELEKVFLQLDDAVKDEDDDAGERRKKAKSKMRQKDEDDEDDDEEPAPKKSAKSAGKKSPPAKASTKAATTKSASRSDEKEAEADAKFLIRQAKLADEDEDENDDAVEALKDRAEAVDLDPDDFKTYAKLAKAIIAAEEEDEDEDDDDDDEDDDEDDEESESDDDDDDDEDDEDEDDEPAPKKSKPTPKGKGKAKVVEEDDDDDDDEDWDDEDDEDEEPPKKTKAKPAAKTKTKPAAKTKTKPAAKGKGKAKPPVDDDDDDDEDWDDDDE